MPIQWFEKIHAWLDETFTDMRIGEVYMDTEDEEIKVGEHSKREAGQRRYRRTVDGQDQTLWIDYDEFGSVAISVEALEWIIVKAGYERDKRAG